MAELALGIVALTFQVFSGVVQGYQIISEAKHMPADCQHLRVRLKTEQYRLLDWADVVRLDETDEQLLISNSTKGLLLDVLDQQNKLLQQFGRLDDKYRKLTRPLLVEAAETTGDLPSPPSYSSEDGFKLQRAETDFQSRFPQTEELLKKSLAYARRTTEVPRRLKWSVFDKSKMENLVLKLTSFNDFMREMLNQAQLETLAIKQTRTEFQIMQLNSSIKNLVQIFESAALTMKHQPRKPRHPTDPVRAFLQAQGFDDTDDETDTLKPGMQSLATLAQIKAQITAIEDPTLFNDELTSSIALPSTTSKTQPIELKRADIRIINPDEADPDSELQRVEAYYQPPHSRKTSVWIEWKTYDPPAPHPSDPDPKIHARVHALASLLRENNRTDQFRAPHCLGYFRDHDSISGDDHYRFGLVFEKPRSAHPSTHPTSLHSLLTDHPELDMPSLTSRIALMRLLSETLERLHAVNWLHKGLRSSNILFFSDSGPGDICYTDPYISGFDYSRPAMNDDMTEKPPESAAEDIYRHPLVQGSGNRDPAGSSVSGRGYKKSYDLYALGVILLEIAYWEPIDKILKIEDLKNAKPSVTIKARQRLLSEEEGVLKWVRGHLGERVVEVVRACLEGAAAFGVDGKTDERSEGGGACLQRGFYEKVVKELGGMRV